jgi:hypothetical protein
MKTAGYIHLPSLPVKKMSLSSDGDVEKRKYELECFL